jgi:threonine/homoserine/homoserine lactone efflux protein
VKAVGAGYIILLGLRAIRDRRALSKALDAPVVPRSDRRIFLEGFIVGAVFVLIALVCDSAWVFVAGTTRDWFAHSPRRLELVGGAGGLMMIAVGIRLAFTGRKDWGARSPGPTTRSV